MASPRDPSWLLERCDSFWLAWHRPEDHPHYRMWWAVIRQAAHDLRYGHKQEALDAIEFLKGTGLWLATHLFPISEEDYKHEVAGLLLRRNREKDEHLYEGS